MDIVHDLTLDVAVAPTRKTKVWKNRQVQWSALLDKLSTTTRTPETMAEYKAMSRDQQSDIKDVGGFVGGYCNNGNRSNVRHRSVLCLDADYADSEVWADYLLIFGNAAAAYSTHKHTPEKPRLRLVIPLARNVTPDEYQAIGRWVAYRIGIDKFDDTTYQPQRLMYWPSTSQDGAYYFEYTDGEPMQPDDVLGQYTDWSDISSWPTSSRVATVTKKTAEKQGDPTQKKGVVGAFCRAYNIHEAIAKFIPDYTPCGDGRYTYTQGSTAAGVVTYDDKFSFSHHATDPASNKLCNAWDLVRLHKYGDFDDDPDTPLTKRASYKSMTELALSDDKCKVQLIQDRMETVQTDFSEPVPESDDGTDWMTKLRYTDKGALATTIDNATIILQHDPQLAGILAYNEMEHNIVALRDTPWRSIAGESQWIDADDSQLRHYAEKVYGLSCKDKIFDAVNVVALAHSFHPVKEYLEGCTWDGVPRLETLLVDYLGAQDTPYTRAVTKKALTAAVARIYKPGCKFDYMLTIRGRQGLGKSALISRLGGKWYSDSFSTMQGKEAYEQVLGVWIMEVGELAGMRKAEAETIKLYISKQKDRFRPAYGRRMQEYPRQCIFIGTTNENEFLRDTTGNRRFWVVDTPGEPKRSWATLTDHEIDLIWGEAVDAYRRGEKLYLPPDLEEEARHIQEAYEEESPKAGLVAEYLERKLPDGWQNMDTYARRQWLETADIGTQDRRTVSVVQIYAEALGGNPEKMDRYDVKEIVGIMAGFPEWRRQGNQLITAKPYGRQKYWKRGDLL